MKEKILIVDDDQDVLDTLKFALKLEGYEVMSAANGHDALNTLHASVIDLVITDIKMPMMNGVELIRRIRESDDGIEIIALTGHATVETAIDVLKNGGAFDFLRKPLEDVNQLFLTMEKALERRRLRKQNRELVGQISKLSAAVEQSPSMVIITDKQGIIEYVTPKFTQITGYNPDEVAGETTDILRSVSTSQDFVDMMWDTILDGREWRGEFINRKKNGELYWEKASIKALKDNSGEITHFLKVAEDITEQKRIEISLEASERFNQAIIDSLPFNIVVLNKQGVILKANRTWQNFMSEQSGVTEGIGGNFSQLCGSQIDDKEIVTGIKSVLNGERDRFEKEFLCKYSSPEKWFLLQACSLENGEEQTVISQVDITRIKQLETSLIHNHKMQAVATLAGGIAHQFNNALSAITGFTELLQMSISDTKSLQWLSMMESASKIMLKLTKQLLSFSQQGKYNNKILSLNDIVRDTLPLLHNIMTSDMKITSDLADDLAKIKADPSQMQMVLYELVVNSIEAAENSWSILITSRNIDENPLSADSATPFQQNGRCVSLIVKDNGTGVENTIKDRIFEPFFTTKFQGRGLGLAAVYGIIQNHNGRIYVDSETGKGAEVRILLPAVDELPIKKRVISAEPEQNVVAELNKSVVAELDKSVVAELDKSILSELNKSVMAEHGEKKTKKTILIIEDNEFNMDLAVILFGKLGFDILKAENGTQAIEIVNNYKDTIDLIYLDMVLPDMGGEDIYPVIVKKRPDTRIIVCSGYSLQEAAEKIGVTKSDFLDFFPKPISLSKLRERLKLWFVLETC